MVCIAAHIISFPQQHFTDSNNKHAMVSTAPAPPTATDDGHWGGMLILVASCAGSYASLVLSALVCQHTTNTTECLYCMGPKAKGVNTPRYTMDQPLPTLLCCSVELVSTQSLHRRSPALHYQTHAQGAAAERHQTPESRVRAVQPFCSRSFSSLEGVTS